MAKAEEKGVRKFMAMLLEAKEWTIAQIVSDKPYTDAKEVLRGSFRAAVLYHDDEAAQRHFGYLMQAIQDEVDEATEVAVAKLKIWGEQHVRKEVGQVAALKSRANEARTLYAELPKFQDGLGVEWTDQDSTRSVLVKKPTLIETKKTLLLEVAHGWAETDQAFPTECFKFLLSVHGTAMFREERDLVDPVLRETARLASSDRLTETMRRSQYPDAIADTLCIAWVKKGRLALNDVSSSALILGAVGHFHTASPAATNFLRNLADHLLNLDSLLRKIPGMQFRYEVIYTSLESVVLRFESKGGAEADLHRRFEQMRNAIQTARKHWIRPYSATRIRLVGNQVEPYGDKVIKDRIEDL